MSQGRSTNFSSAELDMIISTMEEYPEMVSGEFTFRLKSKAEHQKQWEMLANNLMSINMGIPRYWKQVRNKWNDLKYRTKQKNAKIKKYELGTGGGPSQSENLTEIEERILQLIGKSASEGIMDESSDTSALVLQSLKNINSTSESCTILEMEIGQPTEYFVPMTNNGAVEDLNNSLINMDATPVIQGSTTQLAVIPPSPIVQDNTTTPKTSWPVRKSSKNRSTIRGQKHRERKRQKVMAELRDFELEALESQKNLSSQVKGISDTINRIADNQEDMKSIKESITSQQSDVKIIKETLLSINENTKIMKGGGGGEV